MVPWLMPDKSLNRPAAERAVAKRGIHGSATGRTGRMALLGRLKPWLPCFSEDPGTALALQEWSSSPYGEKRDEKKGHIVIHSFQLGPIETTLGTHPGRSVNFDRLGLNACNEKKHGLPFSKRGLAFFPSLLYFLCYCQ